jgi:hypothetical protein
VYFAPIFVERPAFSAMHTFQQQHKIVQQTSDSPHERWLHNRFGLSAGIFLICVSPPAGKAAGLL